MFLGVCAAMAAPAQMDIVGDVTHSRVIRGGSTNINAYVKNPAPVAADDLHYRVQIEDPGGGITAYEGTRPAGGARTGPLVGVFNSGGKPLGINTTTIRGIDRDGILDEVVRFADVNVVARSHPYLYQPTKPDHEAFYYWARSGEAPAQEPSVDPLAFGATGGGESFAAVSAAVGNMSRSPTASLNLLGYTSVGSPEITTDLTSFMNLVADLNETNANPHFFNVLVALAHVGNFSKRFTLQFADENIPGGESFDLSFTVKASVVPEPGMLTVLASAGVILFGSRIVKRDRRRVIIGN
jgi:hypothetical protein